MRLSTRQRAHKRPASFLVEPLSASVWFGAQPEARQPLLKQPLNHGVVQTSSMTAAFVIRVHKQSPDIASNCVANGETDNGVLILGDPSAPRYLDGGDVVLFGDACRDKTILVDRHADPVHTGNVGS